MNADKMFEKMGFEKKEYLSELCFEKLNFDMVTKSSICFDYNEQIPYFYIECDEDDCEVCFPLSKDLLKAINKKLKELGW